MFGVFVTITYLTFFSPNYGIKRCNNVGDFLHYVNNLSYTYDTKNLEKISVHEESAYYWAYGALPPFEQLINKKYKLTLEYFFTPEQINRLLNESTNSELANQTLKNLIETKKIKDIEGTIK